MQSFFLPSPSQPQPQPQQEFTEVAEKLQLDWAEGWFTSAQLDFPFLEENFDRRLHPLITQYILTKQQHNGTLTSLLEKWGGAADLVECNGCGAEV